MAWDASTDAAIAALLVAFVALMVTGAQAIQQYLVSGQLIRICDSVVYGKMPGQGRRIWEFSQFRFRVVYSIPQIRLRLDLWSDIPSQTLSDEEGDLTLPDLQTSIVLKEHGPKQVIKKQFDKQMGRTRDHICGEASWVSFCRAIQHSSGKSLRYEMIEGDADRCPTDLPVVPMQLSMRDVITVAMMAGMECTDVSYQQQSLSMQGRAGTITSSRHPILGALIHFAPKLLHENHGFRANEGTVNPQWMARMRDIMTVAGQQYNIRDRKHVEEDEGHWAVLSADRSMVKYQEKRIQQSPRISNLRRRRGTRGSQVSQSKEVASADHSEHSITEVIPHKLNYPTDSTMRRPQDGEWRWSFSSEGSEAEKASASHETKFLAPSIATRSQALPSRNWYYQLASFLRRRLSATIDLPHNNKEPSVLPVSEPIRNSRHKIQSEAKAVGKRSNTEIDNLTIPTAPPVMTRSSHPKLTEDDLHGQNFKNYVEPRPRVANDEAFHDSPPIPRRLLLTNEEAAKSKSSSILIHDDQFTKSEKKLAAARAEQIARKWQNIVKSRQEVRARKYNKEQDLLRRKDDLRQGEKAPEQKTAQTSEPQLRIGESSLARGRSDGSQSEFEISPRSPGPQSRRENSTSSPQNIDTRKSIPSGARWTKIDRKLVNPQVLEDADENFEYGPDYVVVLRVLTKKEIEIYASRTQKIREARKERKPRVTSSELFASSGNSSLSEASSKSFERLRYEAPRKEASLTEDGFVLEPYPDQPPHGKISSPLPSESKSEFNNLHPASVENPSAELKLKGLPRTRRIEYQVSFSNDETNYRYIASPVDFKHGVSQTEKSLPEAGDAAQKSSREISQPDTTSPLENPQDHHNAQSPSKHQDKRRNIAFKSRARLSSSTDTENSNIIENELLHLEFENLLKKAGEKIKQCDDVPVALKHFLNSQTDPRYSTDEVIAVHDQLEKTKIMVIEILRIANNIHEQRALNNTIVSNLKILVKNLGNCLDVLESDFQLFEITHMDAKTQQKTWDEMLLVFEKRNSNSLLDYLQIACSFGNAVVANIRAGRDSSPESNELKKILLEMNQMQSQSLLPMLVKRKTSSIASLSRSHRPDRRRARNSRYPFYSDIYSSSEAGNAIYTKRRKRDSYKKTTQKQKIPISTQAPEDQPSPTGAVNWLWICQADTIPGYFATPWKGIFSEATCIGAISTVLHGLNALTDSPTFRYVEKQRRYQDWIYAGNVTYPSYALNAKGGVVVSGLYKPVPFAGFPDHLPAIELLHSYDHQVRRGVCHQQQQPSAIVEDLAELAGLDTWLSLCGRTPPIYDGASNLLHTLPALAQCILSDFEFEFANLDRTTSTDGRFQLIQIVAESLTAALTEQKLSEPERLFAKVAFLRAAKTALCVVRGGDTAKMRDVLEQDIQVYLA